MTKEEKEAVLHCLRAMIDEELCEECPLYGTTGTDHCEKDCVRLAIDELEQKPCEDCVRRQEVLDVLKDKWNMFSDANDAMQESINAIKALKSVTPQQMTGHWIDGVCSECGWDAGQEAFSEDANFCMKCGVKMLPIGAEKE